MGNDCINVNKAHADFLESLRGSTVIGHRLFGGGSEAGLEARIAEALEAAELTDKAIAETDCGRLIELEAQPEILTRGVERIRDLLSR